MTVGVDDYFYTSCNRYSGDPGDKGVRLCFSGTNANCVGLARNTSVRNIDIVTASGEMFTGFSAQRDVERTSGITRECIVTVGRVVVSACVAAERRITGGRITISVGVPERKITGGRVLETGLVPIERPHTVRDVEGTGCVKAERRKSRGRVVTARCVGEHCIAARGRIAVAACVVPERSDTGGRVVVAG